ncbi:hypothetical protein [Pseudothioclava nitratireducens]|uniref:hypothetical protein n=1 Tax=Pseudothioclava nitratireducens TaxID=1928646 RepID=UPI0023D9ED9D|nr:hypothetical protein [Defluviimonas nitratireducens]MDF1619267.1 hypothetical protein [Defluviimonas nitratireducens]
MTIRLAVVSTAENTTRIMPLIGTLGGDQLKIVLHIGNNDGHFKASSLARLSKRPGTEGHLMASQRWTGAAQSLIEQDGFLEQMETFIDQLH